MISFTPERQAESAADSLQSTMVKLRAKRRSLFGDEAAAIQREAVSALSRIATVTDQEHNNHGGDSLGYDAHARDLAQMCLDAMLAGWSEEALWRLIDSEAVHAPGNGPGLALHIIASNTPLLAWSSVARALLVGAASVVRFPQGSLESAFWTRRFQAALSAASPALSELVEYTSWPSSDKSATAQAALLADTVVVYGSDETVSTVQALTPPTTRFVGYGNRLSIGYVEAGADYARAAEGTALDMLIFDQQGCLSPQFVFVAGELRDVHRFADSLAAAAARQRDRFPTRNATTAAKLQEAAMLARFESGAIVRHDPEFAWSIAVMPESAAPQFGLPGYITLVPVESVGGACAWLTEHRLMSHLQGVSWARAKNPRPAPVFNKLTAAASYVCKPGWLQRPPFSWREDNFDVLRSLL